jgi:hypothetical protein
LIWLISLQGMTRPWRCEINDLATNVVQTVGALSSTIRYRRIERLFQNSGVRHLGMNREILRWRPFLDKGCVRPRYSNEVFSNGDSVSILGVGCGLRLCRITVLFDAGLGLRSRNVCPCKFRQMSNVSVVSDFVLVTFVPVNFAKC